MKWYCRRRLRVDNRSLGIHSADIQEEKLVQRCSTLQRRIDVWVKIQELYMPNAAALRLKFRTANTMDMSPGLFKLWMPSQIGRTAPCDIGLQKIEWKLRYAQAHDALRSVRSNLRAQTAVLKYKDRHLRGQGANTRARNTLKSIEVRIEAAATRYEAARQALLNLEPLIGENSWHISLRVLNRSDIRSMSDLLWGETEGRKKLLWIWNMHGAVADSTDQDSSMEGMSIIGIFIHCRMSIDPLRR
jgi:hypothetical protein